MKLPVVTILIFLLGVASVHSIVASDDSSRIGDGDIPSPNQISAWYRTPLGKFSVMAIPPILESASRDATDSEQVAWIYDGPHAYSSFRRAIVVEHKADLTVYVLVSDRVAADSLVYEGVEPGWYGLLFGTADEVEAIRIKSGEQIVGEWRENH